MSDDVWSVPQDPEYLAWLKAGRPMIPLNTDGVVDNNVTAAEETTQKAAGIDGEREKLRKQIAEVLRKGPSGLNWEAYGADAVMAEVVDPLLAKIQRVEKLTQPFDDGGQYVHDHYIGDGHDGCPACWAQDIRRALEGGS